MSKTCLKCKATCEGYAITNQRIRRNRIQVDYFYLNPATPILPEDETNFPGLNQYLGHNGALVGQDQTTGYLKMAWEYDDVAVFAAEFVGVLDYGQSVAVDCRRSPRPCCGKVTVITKGGGAVYELASPMEVWTHQCVQPYLDESGPTDFVHPFKVVVVPSDGAENCIGSVKLGKPGKQACAVEINVCSQVAPC